jgi:small subunit ribosomal protein S18
MSEDRKNNQGGRSAGGMQRQLFRRRKTCPFKGEAAPIINYQDTKTLERYLSERGRIMPSRISYVCAKHQRALTNAIKRARHLALLPYIVK